MNIINLIKKDPNVNASFKEALPIPHVYTETRKMFPFIRAEDALSVARETERMLANMKLWQKWFRWARDIGYSEIEARTIACQHVKL